ncbi:MAG: aldehyde dehydrogenase family protein, partial [Acidimicrobiales bacterium]
WQTGRMDNAQKFYINGAWVAPQSSETLDVINPATEEAIATIALGNQADLDSAVAAAKAAFPSFASTTPEERSELLGKIIEVYKTRMGDLAKTVSQEMGAPMGLASAAQAPSGLGHLMATKKALDEMEWQEELGSTTVVYEPIGVCGFITPWNWPLNQIVAKVAPAIAAGCTMVLKPSEVAPLNALIFAEILDEAGVPAGVFNLVNGDGPTVGAALSAHPDVDMMSFTGSTRAGVLVAEAAAPTVKRVAQELGGKSANVILDDVNVAEVVGRDMFGMHEQRPVVQRRQPDAGASSMMEEAMAVAAGVANSIPVGQPDAGVAIGPVVSELQYNKIQALIQKGIDEVQPYGLKRPRQAGRTRDGLFRQANRLRERHQRHDDHLHAKIFGPVITMLGYDTEDEAVEIANDTVYGLSGYVSAADQNRAIAMARRLLHRHGAHQRRSSRQQRSVRWLQAVR